MSGQHKMLPDGTGQGKGWLLAQAANKGFYTMAAQGQQPWAQVFKNQLHGQQGGGGRNRNQNRNRNRQGCGYGNAAGRVDWSQFDGQGGQWGF